jgi:hypothetical protein
MLTQDEIEQRGRLLQLVSTPGGDEVPRPETAGRACSSLSREDEIAVTSHPAWPGTAQPSVADASQHVQTGLEYALPALIQGRS